MNSLNFLCFPSVNIYSLRKLGLRYRPHDLYLSVQVHKTVSITLVQDVEKFNQWQYYCQRNMYLIFVCPVGINENVYQVKFVISDVSTVLSIITNKESFLIYNSISSMNTSIWVVVLQQGSYRTCFFSSDFGPSFLFWGSFIKNVLFLRHFC